MTVKATVMTGMVIRCLLVGYPPNVNAMCFERALQYESL